MKLIANMLAQVIITLELVLLRLVIEDGIVNVQEICVLASGLLLLFAIWLRLLNF
jgi:hypothetical protein